MITYNIVKKNIVGTIDGKPFNVPYSKKAWAGLVQLDADLESAPSAKAYKKLIKKYRKAQKKENAHNLGIKQISPNLVKNLARNTYHLCDENDPTKISKVALPTRLVEEIKYLHENELPVEPVIKYAFRLLGNHKMQGDYAETFFKLVDDFVSKTYVDQDLLETIMEEQGLTAEVATPLATLKQTPINMEGLIVCKKVVTPDMEKTNYIYRKDEETGEVKLIPRRQDSESFDQETGKTTMADPEFAEEIFYLPGMMGRRGDDWYNIPIGEPTPDHPKFDKSAAQLTHHYRVGMVASLPSWEYVNTNDGHSCVKGLHVGGQDYIRYMENDSNATLNCAVDPRYIGAVASDSGGVLRVKEYIIMEDRNRKFPNRQRYHASSYATIADEAYEAVKAAALENLAVEEKDLKDYIQQKRDSVNVFS